MMSWTRLDVVWKEHLGNVLSFLINFLLSFIPCKFGLLIAFKVSKIRITMRYKATCCINSHSSLTSGPVKRLRHETCEVLIIVAALFYNSSIEIFHRNNSFDVVFIKDLIKSIFSSSTYCILQCKEEDSVHGPINFLHSEN